MSYILLASIFVLRKTCFFMMFATHALIIHCRCLVHLSHTSPLIGHCQGSPVWALRAAHSLVRRSEGERRSDELGTCVRHTSLISWDLGEGSTCYRHCLTVVPGDLPSG